MTKEAIALVHRTGGGAAPRTREACSAICDEHPGSYVFCSVPYTVRESTRWLGMDDTTPPPEIAEVVAAIERGKTEA